VTYCAVRENVTVDVDSEGLPKNAIRVTVRGGDDQEIAETIFKTKAGGIAARWRHGGPVIALIAAKQTWAKLLSGIPVIDDFTVTPAPWNEIVRRWWDRLDLPPSERRAAADTERAAYQATHPEETAAWNARLAAKKARQSAEHLDYNAPRFRA
jgi:hypothetical protein